MASGFPGEAGQEDAYKGPEGPEDGLVEYDPLAELAAELAMCLDATKAGVGGFCDGCTCTLRYHLTTDNGECETCGCVDLYKSPPLPFIPSAKLSISKRKEHSERSPRHSVDPMDRNHSAREALRELTE